MQNTSYTHVVTQLWVDYQVWSDHIVFSVFITKTALKLAWCKPLKTTGHLSVLNIFIHVICIISTPILHGYRE